MKNVDGIYFAARELSPEERPAYLTKVCGGDGALRARVEQMLAVANEAEAFIPDPTEDERRERETGEQTGKGGWYGVSLDVDVGQMLGRYKLLERVGEGGCGVVYVAEQTEPVRRRVALKVIKLGMDTRQVVARFEAERQALAMMDHPNIAKVLDAGATEAGRPYFVMELVRGTRITDYCDQANLSTPERLNLFAKVCLAIQHAHQKGIIHRDIKPSNILVTLHDGVPVPKVIDFGIAKATEGRLTEATVYTQLHQFIGTPSYMSPEQAEVSGLDIDTRSDIYSLGVLLYEMLAGTTPFDANELVANGIEAMRRIIREREPMRPSTRCATLKSKELAAAARRRSTDTTKLVRQLQGDLDWIVMKCLEKDRSRRYETSSALAADIVRHLSNEPVVARPPSTCYRVQKAFQRNRLAFAAAGVVAGVLVLGIMASSWQAIRATRAEKRATAETERATLAERSAIAAASRAANAESLANARLAEAVTERDAKEQARKEAEEITKFLIEVFQSPDPTRDGRSITVAETLDTAAKKLETDLAAQPGQRAKLQATLGKTFTALRLFQPAIPLYEKVRDYYLAAHGPEHLETLSALRDLEASYFNAGRMDETIGIAEEILALRRKMNGSAHPDTLRQLAGLALFYGRSGRQEEALKLREEALILARETFGPLSVTTLNAMSDVAVSYSSLRGEEETLRLREEVLALSRKALSPVALSASDDAREQRTLLIMAMQNLAVSYLRSKRWEEALDLLNEKLKLIRQTAGREHPEALQAMRALALGAWEAGRRHEATKLLEEVVPLTEKLYGPEHPDTVNQRAELGEAYAGTGRTAEALSLFEDVSVRGPENTVYPSKAAALQVWLGKTNEYIATCRRRLAWAKEATKPEEMERTAKLACLGATDDATIQGEALALARKAVDLGKGHMYEGYFLMALGMAECRSGLHREAASTLLAAAEREGKNSMVTGTSGFYRAMSLFRQGKEAEARELFAAMEASMKPFPPDEENPLFGDVTHDHLILWLACREAKVVLQISAFPKP